MTSLQSKLRQIGIAFALLTNTCYHYYRPVNTFPCIIWQEIGESGSFNADNAKREQRIVGTLDCFTKTEFDSLLDSIQGTFETLGLTWQLDTVQYETDTGLIHYTWSWGVTFNGQNEVAGT